MRKTTLALLIEIIFAISAYGYYDLIRQNGGFSALAIKDTKESAGVIYEQNSLPEVYFTTYENITPIMLDLISKSSDIKCAVYEVSEPQIVQAFKEKNSLIAVENDYYYGEFHTGNSSGEMHNKFCVFDNDTVMTGSTNLNFEGIYRNDNNLLIIHSRYIAQNYLDEWSEIYADRFATGEKVRYPKLVLNNDTFIQNYFCPEDSCETHVLEELSKANQSIRFMTFSFTDKKIADLLVQKSKDNIDVKGVFSSCDTLDKKNDFSSFNSTSFSLRSCSRINFS